MEEKIMELLGARSMTSFSNTALSAKELIETRVATQNPPCMAT